MKHSGGAAVRPTEKFFSKPWETWAEFREGSMWLVVIFLSDAIL